MTQIPRSYLFVPGDRPDRFTKALSSGSDCIVIDLEDAVAPDAKSEARENASEWLRSGGRAVIRVNGIGTEWHAADMAAVQTDGVTAVMLPKAEASDALATLAANLSERTPLLPIIESAAGLISANTIAALPRVQRLVFGSVDYANDVGISSEDDLALYHARASIVVASAANGLAAPVDGVTLALSDDTRLREDAILARRLGLTGKLCIHPRQVLVVNEIFSPTSAEIAEARRILAAVRAAGSKGAIRLDNKMIDRPIVERAKRTLIQVGEEVDE